MKEFNKDLPVEDQVDLLSTYAFEVCQVKSKDLLELIFQSHKIIKEEASTSKVY